MDMGDILKPHFERETITPRVAGCVSASATRRALPALLLGVCLGSAPMAQSNAAEIGSPDPRLTDAPRLGSADKPGTPRPTGNGSMPVEGAASSSANVCDAAGLNLIRQLSFDRGGRHGTGCVRLAAEAALRRCRRAAPLGFASAQQTPELIVQPVRDAGSAALNSPAPDLPRIAPQHPKSPN